MRYKKWLFVPATQRFLSSRLDGLADVLVFDLEDSIRTYDKQNARERLCLMLEQAHSTEIYIRINTGREGEKDLSCLQSCLYDGLILPKVDDPAQVMALSERAESKQIIALVETVAGIVNLEQIASLPCLFGIAFGGEDYCRELGVETNDLAMQYARGRIALLSRYYKKYCLDTISMEYRDKARFLGQFKSAISMGFQSKLLIHPSQADAIREWEETTMTMDEMKRIVHAFDESTSGLVEIDGRWYEKPHIDRFKAIIMQVEMEDAEHKRTETVN